MRRRERGGACARAGRAPVCAPACTSRSGPTWRRGPLRAARRVGARSENTSDQRRTRLSTREHWAACSRTPHWTYDLARGPLRFLSPRPRRTSGSAIATRSSGVGVSVLCSPRAIFSAAYTETTHVCGISFSFGKLNSAWEDRGIKKNAKSLLNLAYFFFRLNKLL